MQCHGCDACYSCCAILTRCVRPSFVDCVDAIHRTFLQQLEEIWQPRTKPPQPPLDDKPSQLLELNAATTTRLHRPHLRSGSVATGAMAASTMIHAKASAHWPSQPHRKAGRRAAKAVNGMSTNPTMFVPKFAQMFALMCAARHDDF